MCILSTAPTTPRSPAASPPPASARSGTFRACLPVLLFGAWAVQAEPFVIEAMPVGFDGSQLLVEAGERAPVAQANAPVAVDFDGDGQPSWYAGGTVVAHPRTPTVLNPDRYQIAALPTITLPVCPSCTVQPLAFAVADVNRDGRPDIIRVNQWNGHSFYYTFQAFLGNGDNTFSLGWRNDFEHNPGYASGPRHFQLALADLDRDGDPDLVVHSTFTFTNWDANPNHDEGSLVIRWNQNGSFDNSAALQSRDLGQWSRLQVVDLDRDGDVEITADWSTTWTADDTYTFTNHIFDNNGSGAFTTLSDAEVFSAFGFPDANRDGWPDYVFRGYSAGCGSDICLRLNDGSGVFNGSWHAYSSLANGDAPEAYAFADMDEDGRPDFITAEGIASGDATRLTLHRFQTSTSVGPAETLATMSSNIVQIGTGDARGDADVDLLIRLADGSFRLVRNTAQRLSVRAADSVAALTVAAATRLATFDGNRDGIDDLFALQPGGPRIHRALGNGSGGFAAGELKTLAGAGSDFAWGDFDRDGRTDLAYVVPASGDVHLLRQTNPLFAIWNDTTIANYPGAAQVEAGQGALLDGTLDLAVASNSSGGLRWLRNIGGAISWSAVTPRTGFAVMPTDLVLIPGFAGLGDTAVTCGDGASTFSIDGYSNVLGWYRSISLAGGIIDPMPGICFAANLDLDVVRELVFESPGHELWFWDPNASGSGPFMVLDAAPQGVIQAFAVVDWNRDGLNDLLVGTSAGLYVYAREGMAESWQRHRLQRDISVLGVAVLDADRDSLPDAALLASSGVRWVRNLSQIVQASAPAVPPPNPLAIAPNAYGDAIDIAITNPGRENEDASIAVTGTRVVFRHAVDNAGNWGMGAAMTPADVQQAVASVALLVDGSPVGLAYANEVAADGSLQVDYSPSEGGAVPITADQTRSMKLRVTLKPSADSASFGSFFISHPDWTGTARVLNGSAPNGRIGTFGFVTSNRIVIDSSLFEDGFETPP